VLFLSRYGRLLRGAHIVFGLDNCGEAFHLNSGRAACPLTRNLLQVFFTEAERWDITHAGGWWPREVNFRNDRACAESVEVARGLCPELVEPPMPAGMLALLRAWAPHAAWDPRVWE
jgi:hypothetical protein